MSKQQWTLNLKPRDEMENSGYVVSETILNLNIQKSLRLPDINSTTQFLVVRASLRIDRNVSSLKTENMREFRRWKVVKGCRLSRREMAYICYLMIGVILGRGGWFRLTHHFPTDTQNEKTPGWGSYQKLERRVWAKITDFGYALSITDVPATKCNIPNILFRTVSKDFYARDCFLEDDLLS